MRTVKKYSNRRLYDTKTSAYITLDELAAIVRDGDDVRVVDAKSGEDLTQATLAQIVVESGAARLLPTTLLTQMIRMGDDAMAEFMSLYVAWAFEVYSGVKRGVSKVPGVGAMGSMDPTSPWTKVMQLNPWFRAAQSGFGGAGGTPQPPPVSEPEPEPEPEFEPEVAPDQVGELRKELDELKQMLAAVVADRRDG